MAAIPVSGLPDPALTEVLNNVSTMLDKAAVDVYL
jgi:hypothetical protein